MMTELPIISEPRQKKPDWLRVKLPIGEEYKHVRSLVDTHKLHTICEAATAPIWANAGVQAQPHS
jgi:lipoic acid synthetase